MNARSIRFRLIGWYAGLLTAMFVLLAGLMFWGLKHSLETNLRRTQTRRAWQIADTLLAHVETTGETFVTHEIADLYAPEINGRFIRITRPDGTVLYTSGTPNDQSFNPIGLPPVGPLTKTESSRIQHLHENQNLLIAAVRAGSTNDKTYVVEVGTSMAPEEAMLRHFLLLLAIGLPIAILAAIGGGYLLVNHALAPIDEITQKAEQISQHNFRERLPVARTADEFERLSVALNHMLARLEDAVLNSQRFVADASHELRTPLTVLRAEFEEIVNDGHLSLAARTTLGSLQEEVERLSHIVEGLLALSRLDAGEAKNEWVRFDLAELAATTASQMNLLAEDKKISVTCDASQKVTVQGDRARLKQVVVNLLDNAIKYTPEKGVIRLNVSHRDGQGLLEVSDSGIGIPSEALPHVFDRFYRVDKVRTRDPGGAGLGLSIVKSICTAHGGKVEVESIPGTGSRFRVAMPLAGAAS